MSSNPPPPPPPPPPPMSPPPGYVAYGGPGDVSGFQGIRGVSKAMTILLWIYLPLQVLVIIDQVRLNSKANQFLDGEISESKFKDAVERSASSVVGVLVIPIAVLTMVWMFRMAANLRKMGRPGQTWVPGWAIAGWFLPPCGVYAIPWLMFRELWKGSDSDLPPNDPTWKQRSVAPIINIWWVVYGLIPLLGFFSAAGIARQIRTGSTHTLAERLHDYGWINIAFTVVGMVATVVYIQLVQQLSTRHMRTTHEP